ncbi:hypothetical protein AAE478_001580 [Parahypoxylon ruwenzoriense]
MYSSAKQAQSSTSSFSNRPSAFTHRTPPSPLDLGLMAQVSTRDFAFRDTLNDPDPPAKPRVFSLGGLFRDCFGFGGGRCTASSSSSSSPSPPPSPHPHHPFPNVRDGGPGRVLVTREYDISHEYPALPSAPGSAAATSMATDGSTLSSARSVPSSDDGRDWVYELGSPMPGTVAAAMYCPDRSSRKKPKKDVKGKGKEVAH